ncbi:MAG: FAD-dependent oxidoreductase [Planctomycetes bacterium]|nr:FAD-dependent oxidoreductase [Planctomycetota bacterium]
MAKHPDVAIIGGGIIGLTCAYFLAKAGLSVEVFDRGDFGKEASWAGAGIIPPGNPAAAATPIDRLRAIGSMRYPGFSEELRELTGIDNGYLRCGGIEFLDAEEAADVLPLWENEGIAFEKLSRGALRSFEPALAEVAGEPYLLPGCGQVRNPRHLQALVVACEKVGVTLRPNLRIETWRRCPDLNNPAIELLSAGTTHQADRYLLTAGAWSELFLNSFGRPAGIHPVRGQIVLLKTPTRIVTRVLMLGKRYLVPRLDGHVLIGSTEEPEAFFEKANTAEAVAELIGLAVRTVPALASAELVKCWSGLRPGSPDGLPFIGRVPGWDNLFVATGHFRAGVQLSVGTAQAITELLTGKPTCVPLEAFAVDRQPHSGSKSAFRS